jgi:transposase InsO family protein
MLHRKFGSELRLPAVSTIHCVLDRHGLVQAGRPRRDRAQGTPLSPGLHPNDVWCADFKGEFMLGDRRYCFPLTVTDHASRYLLLCEAMESTCEETAVTAFEGLFRERGVPGAIRSDNGVPFASPAALFQLSRLAVWWLRLGIALERIKPGCPQQNGRHERMHLTLKKETTRPAKANFLQQQARFDDFVCEFNEERPHEALSMKTPAEVYQPSPRPYRGIPEIHYPYHDESAIVDHRGRIRLRQERISISQALQGQPIGLKEAEDAVWLVSFMHYDLGYVDLEKKTLQPLDNPFNVLKV